jgi:hypothetical protein
MQADFQLKPENGNIAFLLDAGVQMGWRKPPADQYCTPGETIGGVPRRGIIDTNGQQDYDPGAGG